MSRNSLLNKAKTFWKKSVSLEPVIVIYIFSNYILTGSQITTNLLIYKTCNLTDFSNSSITEEIDCTNLTWITTSNETTVMQDVNDFQMVQQWLRSGPALFYALFVGGLVDKYGKMKLLSMLPIIGVFLSDIAELMNYAFIDSLPLEFFYVKDALIGIFGGEPIYYIGIYGYGAAISLPEDRPRRMARFDGCERVGMLIGTLLSPFMFDGIGYYGCYGISITLCGLMAAYFMFFVKECPKPANSSEKSQAFQNEYKPQIRNGPSPYKVNNSINYDTNSDYTNDDYADQSCINNLANNYIISQIYSLFVFPCWSMWKVLFKRRSGNLQFIVILIMSIYALFWFAVEEMMMQYNYLLEAFPGFDGDKYSIFTSVNYTCTIFGCIVVLPFILEKVKIPEPVMLFVVLYIECSSMTISAFVPELWQFHLSYSVLGMLNFCKYSLTMSMISKCVDQDEVARTFSLMGIMSALMPMVGNPAYRTLFDKTIDYFPRSVLILSGCLAFFNACCNVWLSTQKSQMRLNNEDEGAVQKKSLNVPNDIKNSMIISNAQHSRL